MSIITQAELDAYADLTAAEQAAIRTRVFESATFVDRQTEAVLSRLDQTMADLVRLEAFVASNLADFQADGTSADAVAARNRILDRIAARVNAISGLSGATRT